MSTRLTLRWLWQMTVPLLIAAPGLLYAALPAATDTLDQAQSVSQSPATVGYSSPKAQLFTAGRYGTLDRVSLYLELFSNFENVPAGAVLTVSIQTVVGGLPSGKQIGSGTVPLSSIPPYLYRTWVDVAINNPIVYAGTQYALVAQTSSDFGPVTWFFANGYYAAGAMVYHNGISWISDVPNNDYAFKTWVVPDTLDQCNNWENGAISGITFAQTFTAGLSGTLDRVGVYVTNVDAAGALEATIQTLKGGYPSGTVIGQGSIPASSIPGWGAPRRVDIAISGATVTAGAKYALVLRVGAGQFMWWYHYGNDYAGGAMASSTALGWDFAGSGNDAEFETYVVPPPPPSSAPPPPPAIITPCSSGVCPAVSGNVTPPDAMARVTSNARFQVFADGAVHGLLNFDDSRTGDFVLQGCTIDSAACALTVTTFACTDRNAVIVAGTYTKKGEPARPYLLTLRGLRNETGTFTLTTDHYSYAFTRNGIVDVVCPPVP